MKYLLMFLSATVFIVICGCNSGVPMDNRLIDHPGEYVLASGAKMVIRINSEKHVDFRVVDANGGELFHSDERASVFQSWQIYWESSSAKLWFNSSDIGCSVWQKDSKGHYSRTDVDGTDGVVIKGMPSPVFAALPTSLQEKWTSFRYVPQP